MGKKAQNLMIALAVIATLFVTVITTSPTDRLNWQLIELMICLFGTGAIITIGLSIAINSPSFYRVQIMEGRLLRSGKLDEETYANSLKNEEAFYKSLIVEYARALEKLVKTNERKGWLLTIAYTMFAMTGFAAIVVVINTFAVQP